MKSMTYYEAKSIVDQFTKKKVQWKLYRRNEGEFCCGSGGSFSFYAQPLRIMHFMDVIIVNFKIVNNKIYIKQKFQDGHRYLQIRIFKE